MTSLLKTVLLLATVTLSACNPLGFLSQIPGASNIPGVGAANGDLALVKSQLKLLFQPLLLAAESDKNTALVAKLKAAELKFSQKIDAAGNNPIALATVITEAQSELLTLASEQK
jgi:hypothetical protein